METNKKEVKDKRSIKQIADDIHGITFQNEIAAVLGGFNVDKFKGSRKGKTIAAKIEKLQEKYKGND